MKKRNSLENVTKTIFVLSSLVLLTACATSKTNNARFPVFNRIGTVAVLPFEGKDGDIFANELESTLTGLQRKKGVKFKVSTRTAKDIQALEEEIRYQSSGKTQSALELGKAMQVNSIMVGKIDTTVDKSRFTREYKECVKHKGLRCKKSVKKTTSCKKEMVKIRVIPKLLDVESGQVLYSHIIDGAGSNLKCANESLSTNVDPYRKARDEILREIAADVAPYKKSIFGKVL